MPSSPQPPREPSSSRTGHALSATEDATARVGDEGAQNTGHGLAAGSADRSATDRGIGRARGGTGVPGWLRWLIPVVLVLAWLGVMGVGGPTFGKLSDVTSNSQADFLPVDSQATQVQDRLGAVSYTHLRPHET